MKYVYHGHVLTAIDPALLPLAEVIHEQDDLALATQGPAVQMPLMALPESALKPVKTRGHAMPPGSGPAGKTCGMRAKWTKGGKSDIRKKDPACAKWSAQS